MVSFGKVVDLTFESKKIQDKVFNTPYMRLLSKRPLFGKLYRIDKQASTVGIGFEDIESFIGENSPVRYNLINDFAFFGIETKSSTSENTEDKGINITTTVNQFAVIPNTIQPTEGSMFSYNTEDHSILYRILKVEEGIIKNNTFYICTYELYRQNGVDDNYLEEIEKQVLERYDFVYENVGGDKKSLILSCDLELVRLLVKEKERISNEYIENFYSKIVNNLICKYDDDSYIYSPFLIEFIKKNKSIIKSGYGLIVEHELRKEKNFSAKYRKSYGENILNRKPYSESMVYSVIKDDLSYATYYNPFSYFDEMTILNKHDIENKDKMSLREIKESSNVIDKILYKYYNKEEVDIISLKEELEDYYIENNIDDFIKIPILLSVFGKLEEELLGKPMAYYNDLIGNNIPK